MPAETNLPEGCLAVAGSSRFPNTNQERTKIMLRLAVILLIVALIAGALGLGGVMGAAIHIAWILAIIAVVLFVIHALTGKTV